jgi:hypothetical protein
MDIMTQDAVMFGEFCYLATTKQSATSILNLSSSNFIKIQQLCLQFQIPDCEVDNEDQDCMIPCSPLTQEDEQPEEDAENEEQGVQTLNILETMKVISAAVYAGARDPFYSWMKSTRPIMVADKDFMPDKTDFTPRLWFDLFGIASNPSLDEEMPNIY